MTGRVQWLLLFWLALQQVSTLSAQTMESVYRLDFRRLERGDQDADQVAQYWIAFALRESTQTFFAIPPRVIDDNNPDYKQRLRNELHLVIDLLKQHSAAPAGPERAAILEQIGVAQSDYALAESVFQMMGPEYCQKKVIEECINHLARIREPQRTQWNQMTSALEYEPFARMLKLTADKKNGLRSEIEEANQDFRDTIVMNGPTLFRLDL